MSEIDRRNMLKTGGAMAAVAIGAATVFAQDKTEKEVGDRDKPAGARCLLTLQLNDIDPETLGDEAKARGWLEKIIPIIAQELVRAKSEPKARGCSVSGTAFGGTGGFGGSGTITCTF